MKEESRKIKRIGMIQVAPTVRWPVLHAVPLR
jgi:hypothetical protein